MPGYEVNPAKRAADAALAGYGPHAGQNHALHAADVHGLPIQLLGRTDVVLDGAEPAHDRTDQADQDGPGGWEF